MSLSIFEEDDLGFEIDFLESVLRDRPEQPDVLRALGSAYTKRGLYEQGLEMDERLVKLRPDEALAHYNLACSYSLVGRVGESITALTHAVKIGYDDIAFMDSDEDLANAREDPRYRRLVKRMIAQLTKKDRTG